MLTKVYLRADGSAEIGFGHLIRCMALGHMLRDDFEVHFVCKEYPEGIKKDLIEQGFFFRTIGREEEFWALLNGKEIVVLDHYGLDIEYHKVIKDRADILVCIDDLHDKEFFADLIINHSPGVNPHDYKTPAFAQFALGAKFALLRPSFLVGAKKKRKLEDEKTAFINFGGSDYQNLTMRALEAVLHYEELKNITVVTGAGYAHQDDLELFGLPAREISFYHDIDADTMAQLISESDIAIVPCSGVLLEALAVGNHVVSGMYVENQKLLFENFRKINAFTSAEDFSSQNLHAALQACLSSTNTPHRVIDGNSGNRIVKIFRQLALEQRVQLRKAKITDLSITYEWATNKAVRAFSFNQQPIQLDGHTKWFLSKIQDPSCRYYIAEVEGREVGSLRFDIAEAEAVISFLIDPDHHNKGLGVPLLKKGLETIHFEEREKLDKIVGFVIPENIASCKTFERFGFSKSSEGGNYKYTLLIN